MHDLVSLIHSDRTCSTPRTCTHTPGRRRRRMIAWLHPVYACVQMLVLKFVPTSAHMPASMCVRKQCTIRCAFPYGRPLARTVGVAIRDVLGHASNSVIGRSAHALEDACLLSRATRGAAESVVAEFPLVPAVLTIQHNVPKQLQRTYDKYSAAYSVRHSVACRAA